MLVIRNEQMEVWAQAHCSMMTDPFFDEAGLL